MIKSAPTTKKQKETHNTKHHFIQQQYSFDLRPHDIYSHAGAGHEDQFITDCGIDPSRIVNTYNMLAQNVSQFKTKCDRKESRYVS
jgi:hypothetical protein